MEQSKCPCCGGTILRSTSDKYEFCNCTNCRFKCDGKDLARITAAMEAVHMAQSALKPLYDRYDTYTTEGADLDTKVREAVEKVIEQYVAHGYDGAHIESIALNAVWSACLSPRSKRSIALRKAYKEQK